MSIYDPNYNSISQRAFGFKEPEDQTQTVQPFLLPSSLCHFYHKGIKDPGMVSNIPRLNTMSSQLQADCHPPMVPVKTGIYYTRSRERPLFWQLWGKCTPWSQSQRMPKWQVCWGLAADWPGQPPVTFRMWCDRRVGLPWLQAGTKWHWWLHLECLGMRTILTLGTQRFPWTPRHLVSSIFHLVVSQEVRQKRKMIKKIEHIKWFPSFSILFHNTVSQWGAKWTVRGCTVGKTAFHEDFWQFKSWHQPQNCSTLSRKCITPK